MERLGHPQVSLCLQRPSWGLKGRVSAFAQNLHGQGASDFKPSICFHGNMLASPRSSSVSFLDSSCAHAGTCTHPECRHTPTPTGIPNSTASSLGTTLLGHKDVLYLHVQSHWVPLRKKKKTLIEAKEGSEQGHAHSLLFKGAPGMRPRFCNENSNRFLDAFQAPASYSILVD